MLIISRMDPRIFCNIIYIIDLFLRKIPLVICIASKGNPRGPKGISWTVQQIDSIPGNWDWNHLLDVLQTVFIINGEPFSSSSKEYMCVSRKRESGLIPNCIEHVLPGSVSYLGLILSLFVFTYYPHWQRGMVINKIC